ncbi:MAG: hypothetical protein RLY86_1248 [Pseudomonadota bacterium]|jgi:voltage-gated potassium channel
MSTPMEPQRPLDCVGIGGSGDGRHCDSPHGGPDGSLDGGLNSDPGNDPGSRPAAVVDPSPDPGQTPPRTQIQTRSRIPSQGPPLSTTTVPSPVPSQRHPPGRLSQGRAKLTRLYTGHGRDARRFQYGLLLFDGVTVAFLVAGSFFPEDPVFDGLGVVFGALILVELALRLTAAPQPVREAVHPLTAADLIAALSLLAPLLTANFAFVRILRVLRMLRTYRLAAALHHDIPALRRNQDLVYALVHLFVFVFVTTSLVYELQKHRNPDITNYADALYFTVTTLTTTGFGDITLEGQGGRLLSVLIMVFGVSLFLRLLQTLFRPTKVSFRCPDCGLSRHDHDAVHCKDCGRLLNIPNEGED